MGSFGSVRRRPKMGLEFGVFGSALVRFSSSALSMGKWDLLGGEYHLFAVGQLGGVAVLPGHVLSRLARRKLRLAQVTEVASQPHRLTCSAPIHHFTNSQPPPHSHSLQRSLKSPLSLVFIPAWTSRELSRRCRSAFESFLEFRPILCVTMELYERNYLVHFFAVAWYCIRRLSKVTRFYEIGYCSENAEILCFLHQWNLSNLGTKKLRTPIWHKDACGFIS